MSAEDESPSKKAKSEYEDRLASVKYMVGHGGDGTMLLTCGEPNKTRQKKVQIMTVQKKYFKNPKATIIKLLDKITVPKKWVLSKDEISTVRNQARGLRASI